VTVWRIRPGLPGAEVALTADVDLDLGPVVLPHPDLELRRSQTGQLRVAPPLDEQPDGGRDYRYRVLDAHRPVLFKALFERYRRHVLGRGRNILRR